MKIPLKNTPIQVHQTLTTNTKAIVNSQRQLLPSPRMINFDHEFASKSINYHLLIYTAQRSTKYLRTPK